MSNGPSNQLNHPLNFQSVEAGKDPLALENVPGSPKQSSLDRFFRPPTLSRSRSITEYRESSVSLSKSCEQSENREIQQQGNKLRKIKSSLVKFFRHPVVKGVGTFLAGLLLTAAAIAGVTALIIATGGVGALAIGIGIGVAGTLISGAAGGKVYQKSKSSEKAASFSEIQDKAKRIVNDVGMMSPRLRLIAENEPSLRKQIEKLEIRLDSDWGALGVVGKYTKDPVVGQKIVKCMETTQQSLRELIEKHGDNLPLFRRKGTEDVQQHPEIEMVELNPNNVRDREDSASEVFDNPNRPPRNHSIFESENDNSMSGNSMFGMYDSDGEDSLAGAGTPEESESDKEIGDREDSTSEVFGNPNEMKQGKITPGQFPSDYVELQNRHRDIVLPVPDNNETPDKEIDDIFLDRRQMGENVTPGEIIEPTTPGVVGEVVGEESVVYQRRDTDLEDQVNPFEADFEFTMVEEDVEMSVNQELPPGIDHVRKVRPRDMDSELLLAIRLLTSAGIREETAIEIISSNRIDSKLIDQLVKPRDNPRKTEEIANQIIEQFNSI